MAINKNNLKYGDILFFSRNSNSTLPYYSIPSCECMYLGNNKYLELDQIYGLPKVVDFTRTDLIKVRRIIEDATLISDLQKADYTKYKENQLLDSAELIQRIYRQIGIDIGRLGYNHVTRGSSVVF